MRIDLTRTWPRTFFLAAVVACGGILLYFSGKAYLATRWSDSSRPELWRRAAQIEPGNATYWARLGIFRQWNAGPGGDREAINYLARATRVDPYASDLWMELADAYQTSGNSDGAQRAYKKAQENFPMSAEVAWRYGNFLLFQEKLTEGYLEIRRAISIDPSLTQSALVECWRADPNVTSILDHVLPGETEYYVGAIDFFLAQHLLDPALAVWDRQGKLGLAINVPETIALSDALIGKDRFAEAQRTWNQGLAATKFSSGSRNSGSSLVFNGGFESDIANGGFDWREVAIAGAQFDSDTAMAYSGSLSLRVRFDGTANLNFQNLFQYVPVEPASRYHFSAYLRTENISTDRGIRFEILDPRHPSQLQIVTLEIRGTNPWTLVQADLATGPDTHLLKITLQRIPSWKFDNKLSGTVWVDGVAIMPIPEPVMDKSG